jgi:hypothetical protein
MASTGGPDALPDPPRFRRPDHKNLAIGVLAGIIASAVFTALVAVSAAFLHIKFTTGAFQALLAMTFVTAVVVIACLSALIIQYRRIAAADTAMGRQFTRLGAVTDSQFTALESAMAQRLDGIDSALDSRFSELQASISRIDWSYDAAEFEGHVYERMRRMVEHPRIREFKIVTIFREVTPGDTTDSQRQALRGYYSALESQMRRPGTGFVYERVVLIRGPVFGPPRSATELFHGLIPARPDFIEHYRQVNATGATALGNRAIIKFYGAHGRLVDVAFAVALDHQRQPLTLVLEVGIDVPGKNAYEKPRRAIGLLAFENPDQALADALLQAHQSIYEGIAPDLELVPDETVKGILLGRA